MAVDNDYAVWRAFSNHFWRAEGRLRYHHFGEGEYAMAEIAVQQLLLEAGAEGIDQDLVMVEPRGLEVAADWRTLQSPETYLGYAQSTGFASAAGARFDTARHYAAAPQPPLNHWDLSGIWTVAQDAADHDGCPHTRTTSGELNAQEAEIARLARDPARTRPK